MPQTLTGWVWFIALLAACVVPRMASADIMECVHRGKLAQSFAQTVAEGYALDKINVRFQRPPRNPKEQAETDAYVESVREEVKSLLGMTPEKIGIKVAEKCAFEYGKRQGFMKEVMVNDMCAKFIKGEWREVRCRYGMKRVGSVPPLNEEQATNLILGASSQGMAEANARYKECEELLTDQIFIAQQLSRGKSPDSLRNLARTSLDPLPEDRLEKVLRLIDEAEKAIGEKGGLRGWFDSYWQACVDGR